MHNNDERRVKEIVAAALTRLLETDAELLRLDLNERTITARLAEYIQTSLPEWHVDAEYNRIRNRIKHIELDDQFVNIVPDIIAHRRETDDNLFVLEAKKVGNAEGDAYDRRKILALKAQQGYRFAVLLRLRTGAENPGIESTEWL